MITMKNRLLIFLMSLAAILLMSLAAILFCGCEKFLDAKPDNTLAHPSTLKDLRAILDQEDHINNLYHGILEIAADDFYITYKGYATLQQRYRDGYVWEDQGIDAGYTGLYRVVSVANVVLEGLARIDGGDIALRRQLEGEALFLRGWMFFQLAQVYCTHYSIHDTQNALGLVLRMDSDAEIKIGRSGLKEAYNQLFSDLTRALELLPIESEYVTRPSKLVCYAALARAYLTVEDYAKAEEMVSKLFAFKTSLLDFNSLDHTKQYPIALDLNVELLYYGRAGSNGLYMANANTYIHAELYAMYDEHDLRRKIYYVAGVEGMRFKGYYHGALADYAAVLAMDEMYLIMAECLARRQEVAEGLSYLNALRKHRYEKGHFTAWAGLDSKTLLVKIMEERRKQLVCRGIRWGDLRRLNRQLEFAVTIHRKLEIDGKWVTFSLEPNSLRYVFLIPRLAIEMGKYEQNPR